MRCVAAAEYERALSESQSEDPTLEQRKRGIVEALAAIEDRAHAVQDNSTAVEEAIYQKMQELLQQLQDETAKKISVLLAEELELRRQLEQLQWADGFVGVMQDALPPVAFVSAWKRHTALLSKFQLQQPAPTKTNCRALEEVHADLELSGQYTVVCAKSGRDGAAHISATGPSLQQALDASTRMLRPSGLSTNASSGSGYLQSVNQFTLPAPEPAGDYMGAAQPSHSVSGAGGDGYDVTATWLDKMKERLPVPASASAASLQPSLALPAPTTAQGQRPTLAVFHCVVSRHVYRVCR